MFKESDFIKHVAEPVTERSCRHLNQYKELMNYWNMHKRVALSTIVDQVSRDLQQVISEQAKQQFKSMVAKFNAGEKSNAS